MQDLSNYVKKLQQQLLPLTKDIAVFVVSNVKKITSSEDYADCSVITDFFSEEEFGEIINGFREKGLYVESFTDEIDFINYVQKENFDKLPFKYKIVYNTSQKGIGVGRHSLIPAYCKVLNIPLIGSNSYVVSLCRHKYHCNKLIKEHIGNAPDAWLYDGNPNWLANDSPPHLLEIIIKPIHEAASIGVKKLIFDEFATEVIKNAHRTYIQPIIVEKFIKGYEVEVPIIIDGKNIYPLEPIGIGKKGVKFLGDEILDYESVYDDEYFFYNFRDIDPDLSSSIMLLAEKASRIIGFQDYARIDFRIDESNNIYLTDTTNNPHIVSHSSVYYCFEEIGLSQSDISLTLLSLAAKRYHWF